MTRPYIFLGSALLMTLSACGDATEPEADTATAEAPVANFQAEIEAMPEGQRNAVFIRAIRDADLPRTCQGVESSTYVGETQGAPTWMARCTDGVEWAIMMGEDGTAQVISTAEAEQAGMDLGATNQAQ